MKEYITGWTPLFQFPYIYTIVIFILLRTLQIYIFVIKKSNHWAFLNVQQQYHTVLTWSVYCSISVEEVFVG